MSIRGSSGGSFVAALPAEAEKHVNPDIYPLKGLRDDGDEEDGIGLESAHEPENSINVHADVEDNNAMSLGGVEGGSKELGTMESEQRTAVPVSRFRKDLNATISVVKYLLSSALLVFSLVIVHAAIFTEQTTIAKDIHSVFAFLLLWAMIAWLAMMEGGQGCLVGLKPIEKSLYADSHPITLKNTNLAHKGDNMERFIVGRQFLAVLVIFILNMCGSPLEDAQVLNLPSTLIAIFLENGIAMIATTIIIAQLTPQVNAAVCMLDFINTYFMLFTFYVSFFIEFSGLLHSVYLVQIVFSKITGNPIESNEPPRNVLQKISFWCRVLLSLVVLGFSLAVTLMALFDGNSGMWDGVPAAASVVIFFLLLAFVGMMEGMQIAAFVLLRTTNEDLATHKIAFTNCQLMFSGQNLQKFLIGRQICVASCMFIVARIAAVKIPEGDGNIFGVSDGFQKFIDTGLLGAVVLTIIGSLAWRIIASSFPAAFMSNPLIYLTIKLCLFLEKSGIASVSWLLALVLANVVGYQVDEIYLGRPGQARQIVSD